MKNFKNLLFVAVLFISASVLGQAKITGEVVDETNQPLPGASIVVKGTTNGTSTDFDGKFTYSKIETVLMEDIYNNDVLIYPNPTSEIVNIEVSEGNMVW